MGDPTLAYRRLYKAQRALRKMSVEDKLTWIKYYELIAKVKISQKELMQAKEYIESARVIQLELGKIEAKRPHAEAKAALTVKETLMNQIMSVAGQNFINKQKK